MRAVAVAAALVLTTALAAVPTSADPGDRPGTVRAKGSIGAGYWMVATDGGIFAFGDADFAGSTGNLTLNKPIVGMAPTPTGNGYWLVASDGGIFAFGDAGFHGSTGAVALNRPIVAIAPTPSGEGYWLVASDGGIFAFGDAEFHGSTGGMALTKPIVAMAATPTGEGYWLVASDGGIFAFGDAPFEGSTGGIVLNKPIVGMAPNLGGGYWLVASDGGIFAFGDAPFHGSTGDITLNSPIVGITAELSGNGYRMVAADGGVFAFGDSGFHGSTGDIRLNKPIVGMAATPVTPLTAADVVVLLVPEEVVPGPGDGDGFGIAFLDFDFDKNELCYAIAAGGIGPVTALELRRAPQGQDGAVVLTFDKPRADGVALGCLALTEAQLDAIAVDLSRHYVEVRTTEFADGALRGPLGGEFFLGAQSAGLSVHSSEFPEFTLDEVGITGLRAGDQIVAIDVRPRTEVAYALVVNGTTGSLWQINLSVMTARQVGTSTWTTDAAVGFDIDPMATNVIRVITQAGQHYVIDADTGVKTDQMTPEYVLADPNAGRDPDIVGLAYAPDGQLYGIDAATDSLVTVSTGGAMYTVGPLGIDVNGTMGGFDIESDGGPPLFLAVLQTAGPMGGSSAWAIDPATGHATSLGALAVDDVRGVAM